MQTIATMNFKGGVGKTTSIFAMASAAVNRNARVLLVDTDQNLPMKKWRESSMASGLWGDLIDVEERFEFDTLYDALVSYDEAGKYDFVFIDPRAGRTEFGLGIAQIVDALLLPVAPEKVEADALIDTLEVFATERSDGKEIAPYRAFFSNMRTESGLTASMNAYRDMLEETVPMMKARLHQRTAFKNMQTFGPLPAIINSYASSSDGLERRQAQHYRVALDEAEALLDEAIILIEEANNG